MIAWWPGKMRRAAMTDTLPISSTGWPPPANSRASNVPDSCDSISFVPTLLGNPMQPTHDFLYWEFHERGFQQSRTLCRSMERNSVGFLDSPVVLYDLQSDIAETTDVAASHPDVAAKIGHYLDTARSDSADWRPEWMPPNR